MEENTANCGAAVMEGDTSPHSNQNNQQKKRRRICCVGMCVLDIIHVCDRYPIEDTDKRCLKGFMQRGGNASNSCTVLRQLGSSYDLDLEVEFLGMMSTAKGFEFLRNDCLERQIIIENCPTVEENPPFSSVILVESTDSRTIVHSNSNFPILKNEHFDKIRNEFDKYAWIHFEARNPEHTLRMISNIREYNNQRQNQCENRITISVEFEKLFKENLVMLAPGADFVFLGKELAMHMGWLNPKEAVYSLQNLIMNANVDRYSSSSSSSAASPSPPPPPPPPPPPSIICPWGSSGASSLDRDGNYAFSKAKPPEKIVDALGAGDTFCAATIFALSQLKSENLAEAVEFGNYCAGAKLGIYGYDGIADKVKDFFYDRKNIQK